MIKVQKFGPAFGLPDPSPFVVKVETYLRFAGEPYEIVLADVRKAPRRQLPVAEIAGQLVPDSTAIIAALEKRRAEELDAHLGQAERALGQAFKSMLEEHLYFGMLVMRWATDEGWAVFAPHLAEVLARMRVPAMLRGMVSRQARKLTVRRTRVQGMGRKPRAEVAADCARILDAMSVQLGDKAYLFGDRPTTYDATGYAFVSGVLCPAFDNEVRRHAASKQNLVAYAERIEAAYWKSANASA